MAKPRSLTILFRPAMEPPSRHAIEDELEEALGDRGEITGGGTAVDMSMCDISVDVVDFRTGLQTIREVLRRLEVPRSTLIVEYEPKKVEYPVYEDA